MQGQQAEEGEELRAKIDEKTNRIQTLLSLYGTDRDGSRLASSMPLYVAAREGHAEIAKMLLDNMGAEK